MPAATIADAKPTIPQGTKLGHSLALDGLRGVAILAVIGINADWSFLQGGFFGVDVFFVLSGFLITTLLLEEWHLEGGIDLARFYKRRAIRLMPALFALLIFATLYNFLLRPPELWKPALQIIASALFYVSNWTIGAAHIHGTLEHTWSLSVEGQFYLLWAVGLAFALKRGATPKKLIAFCLGLFLVVSIWRSVLWLQTHDVMRVYMGLDTRADSLLAGCATALIRAQLQQPSPTSKPAAWQEAAVWFCWLVLGFGFITFKYYGAATFLGGFSLIALATSFILFHAVRHPGAASVAFLSWPALRWFGRVSYSIYLWHVPLKNVCAPERLLPHLHNALLVEVVRFFVFVGMGCVSYYAIERPFLRLKGRFT